MNNLIVTFNIIAPFMLYMLLGLLFRRLGLLKEDLVGGINRLVSTVFLPVFNFQNFLKADLSGLSHGGFIFYIIAWNLIMLTAMIIMTRALKYNPARAGTMILICYINNSMVFGIAVASQMYPPGEFTEVILAAAVLLPFYNALTVPIMQYYGEKQKMLDAGNGDGSAKLKVDGKQLLKTIITNPLVIAVILGLTAMTLRLDLPDFADSFLTGISGLVTPLIFICLGASFSIENVREDRRDLILGLLIKLVIAPMIALILPLKWGYRDQVLLACLVCFAAPTGVTSVPLSRALGCDARLAEENLALSSACSIFTMFLWIFIFKQMGLL